ncbi:bifunctional diguanylate cyclase/phosphodiesterase [Aliiglaciecola sp. LCG003]|uniref:putative bifunctional diguanylate cyclase/phosphodiesterase n=1 Tax=Aliiglaciecola sp. LCG003 TaxID=3053655 RepID=UPI002573FDFD|nr:bifunctional diguanylate cyclase/phosphodiesterase [Aliiglaciecola sp. LCG003]WJG09799.1 bifunctional diguanylate cyclase/phosphodiesterase [Aliiglaciecola sp. LCG003]
MQQSLIQALGIVNCAILKRLDEDHFQVVHNNQDWFYALAPEAEHKSSFVFSKNSAFLEYFFVDAENFWKIGNDGQIQSGIWSEQTANALLRLEAIAAVSKGESYLVINNLEADYNKQQKTLQIARELLISNDQMQAQHDYLHARLDEVLHQKHDLQSLQKPIDEVIQKAEIGVIITDANFQLISQNPYAFELFELANQQTNTSPLEIVQGLFNKQFPEFDRIVHTSSRWHGELFWHKAPYTSKWLQLALYPVKDINQNTQNWVFILSDVSRLKYLTQKNEKLSLYDTVTNLPNRQLFWQTLEHNIETSKHCFVLYMDVKHFKRVNEIYGHQTGDHLLVNIAERVSSLLGENDLCARIGGNEFGLLLQEYKDQQQCLEFSQRLIELIEQPFYTDGDDKLQIAINIGAAHFPSDANDSEELMKFADLAMFAAKKSNKSKLSFYSKALKEASTKRLELEKSLRIAIEEGQFELYLQPIVDLHSNQIIKAEALIRWRLPDGSLTSPDEFIPLAEQTGLIIPIGNWVMTRAAEMLKTLLQHKPGLRISVNLSPRQVADRNIFDFIKSVLKHAGIPASNLELELTEGVLIESFEKVQKLLHDVRSLGISVSIDDFGTGYSSLAYLQKLPIDHLKIDRSFVRDLETNESDKAIVLAVIALAHSLKLSVIAEGVENIAQMQFLVKHQCDKAQGYLFSRPIPFDDFCQLLVMEKKNNSL